MKKNIYILYIDFYDFNIAACSSNNDDYALEFFSALDNTLELNSGHIQGTFTSNNEDASKIKVWFTIESKKTICNSL